MMRIALIATVVLVCSWTTALAAPVTVLYGERVVKVDRVLPNPPHLGDLWVPAATLKSINGFELKPQGACLDEFCVPIEQSGKDSLVITREGEKWFNLSGFARKLGQAMVSDAAAGVWSFGEIPVLRGSFMESAVAPDFAMADRKGKTVHLSDFRGKKVLLLTWASW